MDLNVIYNEDCYEGIKKIPDKSIDLVYIDIPYLIEPNGHEHKKTALAQRIQKTNSELEGVDKSTLDKLQYLKEQMNNAKTKSEYEKYHCLHSNLFNKINLKRADITNGIDYSILDELCRVMKNIYIYIWCSKDQVLDITKYFVEKKGCRVNYLVWCKTNCVPATNDTWLPNIEHCLVFKESKAPRYNDGYDLKSKWYISSTNKYDKDLYDHPTIKPLDLVKRHILHSTKEGDVVLDCFMGSGTTAVACKELGRNYIGFELNPEYYQIAVDRVNGISQKDKRLKEKGINTIFDYMEE